MSTEEHNSRFYVVGGPVQPNRDCYVLRDADMALYTRLANGDFCHVLAPFQTGKTSLMAQTAARLRAEGVRVATVDLANISSREMSADVGRWYYSVAYRICRELRISSDIHAWWQDRLALTNMHRLREFFLDVVLSQTEERIVIFIDRVESALDQPFGRALLRAIRACHDARATEPEYDRLGFALLGAATVGQTVPSGPDSPFNLSAAIELGDFGMNEVRQLTAGLGCDAQTARVTAERVWYWTGGQPYLTQKTLRALARRKTEALDDEIIDATVARLFVARDGPQAEPHLSAIARQLLAESPGRNARLTIYSRVRRGRRVAVDRADDVHRDLLRSGVLIENEEQRFALRNRIYELAYTAEWVRRNRPFGWRGIAIAAGVAVIMIGAPIWYVHFLPDPYVRLLTEPDQDYVTALDAYRRLEFLPGYGDMADELFTEYLVDKSRDARSLREVQGFSERLAEIQGRAELGQQLLGEFWDRRATNAMHRGDRDDALLFALRALRSPTDERRRLVSELYGDDYKRLIGSIRSDDPLRAIEVDATSGLVTTLDADHRVEVWHVTESGPRRIQRFELLAEEIVPLQRRLVYAGDDNRARLVLTVETDHPRPSDVVVELRAPSGRQADVRLPGEISANGVYVLDSRNIPGLADLLDENVDGTWSAGFLDDRQGAGGRLLDWSIAIDGRRAGPPPGIVSQAAAIPEPIAARQMHSVLAPGGRRALTWPAEPGARGDILVWNVGGGEILTRIPRPAGFSSARFVRGQSGVLLTARNEARLWDIERSEPTATISIEPSFEPVLSANGYVLVVDTVIADGEDRLFVWDLDKPGVIGSLATGTLADTVAVDSTGQYMAVGDGVRYVRLWSVADGGLVREFDHAARPDTVRFDPSGRWLITEDAAHTLRVWAVDGGREPALVRTSGTAWSVSVADDQLWFGALGRGFELLNLARGEPRGEPVQHGVPMARRASDAFVAPTALAPAYGYALTYDGREAAKLWRLPPRHGAVSAANDSIPVAPAPSPAAALSADGNRLAVATLAGDVRILAADQQALLLPDVGQAPGFIGHLDRVTRIVFDASGALVASGSFDGSVRVWDVSSGAPRSFFSTHGDGVVYDLAFAGGGQYLVSATRRSVIVTDTASGEQLARLQVQSMRPRLATSADGRRIYIADDRGGLTRWSWQGGVSEPLIGADSGIRDVAVSADESFIVTADRMRRIVILDAGSLEPRGQSWQAPTAVDALFLSPDGSGLLVQDGVWLNLLAVSDAGLVPEATRRLGAPPAAVVPRDQGLLATTLTRVRAAQPVVAEIMLAMPQAPPFEGRLEQFLPELEARLNLTLNDWGEPRPIR